MKCSYTLFPLDELPLPLIDGSWRSLAVPKSISLIFLSLVTSIFSGYTKERDERLLNTFMVMIIYTFLFF